LKAAAIVYEFPSISETFVLAQISGLIDRGWDIRVFADGEGPDADLAGVDSSLRERTTYFGLPFKRAREILGHVLSRTSASARSVESTPREAQLSLASAMRLKFEQRAFARAGKLDLIHAHFGPNGVRAVRLREAGVVSAPIVTSFYGYDVTRHWARSGYAKLFRQGERFIALSETMKRQLIEMGAPADRVIVHRLGIDLSIFDKKPRSDETIELISIARLVEKKGIEFAIRAVSKVAADGVRVRYTVVGDGPLRSRLERLATESNVKDRVRFTGSQSPRQIRDLLSRSDIMLAPSVTAIDGDSEGTPVAILEAQASRIPVISTKHAGIPEIVQDSITGYLVGERDVDAIAQHIRDLARNAHQRERMGDAGRRFVEQHHDINRNNDDLARICSDVTASA
jgi:colanic acid/amylovoran biosynthesis glycosyltransferase